MANINKETIELLKQSLLDDSQPIAKRFRALFTLRNLNSTESIDAMTAALQDKSALLRHEVAYCLGQMENEHSLDVLISLVKNSKEHPMVRHEAAEALGAIGTDKALECLKEFANDTVKEVAETCQLALSRVEWYKINEPESFEKKLYLSVDPAPSLGKQIPFEDVKKQFLNNNLDIFNRYRALFSLRDMGDEKSVLALCESLKEDSSSLLKHEVAFVLGQIQHKAAIGPLKIVLLNENENAMVRHEAAEALGAIASQETVPLLEQLTNDKEPIVSESCLIALDVTDYFNNTQEFQYADGIKLLLEKNLIQQQTTNTSDKS